MDERLAPTTLNAIDFSTEALSSRAKVANWQRVLQHVLVPLTITPRDVATYDAQGVGILQYDFRLVRIRSEPCLLESAVAPRGDAIDHPILLVSMRSGTMEVAQSGQRTIVPAGEGVLILPDRPFGLRFEHPHELVAFLLPRSSLSVPGVIDHVMTQRLCERTAVGPLLCNFALNLAELVPKTEPLRLSKLAYVLRDLIAVAVANMTSPSSGPARKAQSRPTIDRAKSFIELRLGDPNLSATTVASQISRSVRYLNKLFEAEGTSLARYIWSTRLQRAAMDLSRADLAKLSVKEIGRRRGFKNASHFNTAFRDRFQLTPKTYRDRARRLGSCTPFATSFN